MGSKTPWQQKSGTKKRQNHQEMTSPLTFYLFGKRLFVSPDVATVLVRKAGCSLNFFVISSIE